MTRAYFRPTRPDMTLTPAEACAPFSAARAIVADGSCVHWRKRERSPFRKACERTNKARRYQEEKLRILRGEA